MTPSWDCHRVSRRLCNSPIHLECPLEGRGRERKRKTSLLLRQSSWRWYLIWRGTPFPQRDSVSATKASVFSLTTLSCTLSLRVTGRPTYSSALVLMSIASTPHPSSLLFVSSLRGSA